MKHEYHLIKANLFCGALCFSEIADRMGMEVFEMNRPISFLLKC